MGPLGFQLVVRSLIIFVSSLAIFIYLSQKLLFKGGGKSAFPLF